MARFARAPQATRREQSAVPPIARDAFTPAPAPPGSSRFHHDFGAVRVHTEGVLQRAPDETIAVDIVEVSTAESELLFQDLGIRLPGSPPSVQFGSDGPIPQGNRKLVQLA